MLEPDLGQELGPPSPASRPLVLCGGSGRVFAGSLASVE